MQFGVFDHMDRFYDERITRRRLAWRRRRV